MIWELDGEIWHGTDGTRRAIVQQSTPPGTWHAFDNMRMTNEGFADAESAKQYVEDAFYLLSMTPEDVAKAR